MADNVQTTPLSRSIIQLIQNEIVQATQQNPKSLPVSVVAVSNAMVKVKFELNSTINFPQITVPQAISRYARPPTQVGDKGFVVAADLYLGGVTGLGGGVADYLRKEGNLSTLVFVPLSNTNFPSVDGNAYNVTAPNGVVLKDDSGNSKITLTPSSIVLSCGANSKITLTSSSVTISYGSNSIVVDTHGASIGGKDFATHVHSGVTIGSDNTGGVV